MLVTVLTAYWPSQANTGDTARLSAILRYFGERGDAVRLIVVQPAGAAVNVHERAPHVLGCDVVAVPPAVHAWLTASSLGSSATGSLSITELSALRPAFVQAANAVRQLLAREAPDAIWTVSTPLALLIGTHLSGCEAWTFVDTIDVLHRRSSTSIAISRRLEAAALANFDVVVAIQSNEHRLLKEMLPGVQVICTGHAQETDPQPSSSEPMVLVVGANKAPNRDGIIKFLSGAWAAIRERVPGVRLRVVGRAAEDEAVRTVARAYADSVELIGHLPCIRDAYAGPAAVVCPLWLGSGLKIKVVEALAHGKAVVATPIAAEGLLAACPAPFQVVQEPEDFVHPLVELLKCGHERRRWEAAAIDFSRRTLSTSAIYRDLDRVLGQMQSRRYPHRRAA